jgi:hypothetical protein
MGAKSTKTVLGSCRKSRLPEIGKSTKTASRLQHIGGKTADREIEAALSTDPDWSDLEPIDWSRAEVVIPPKK